MLGNKRGAELHIEAVVSEADVREYLAHLPPCLHTCSAPSLWKAWKLESAGF